MATAAQIDALKNPQNWEKTTFVGYDTIAFAPSTLLTETDFFTTGAQPLNIKNLTLPSNLDKTFVITHMKAHHNFQFTLTAGQELWEQQRFEDNSFIRYVIQDTNYPDVPLTFALPYEIVMQGGSGIVKDKLQSMLPLADEIIIPPGGTAKFTFIPAPSVTTKATAATLPILPGYNPALASNLGFYIKLFLYGYVLRPR